MLDRVAKEVSVDGWWSTRTVQQSHQGFNAILPLITYVILGLSFLIYKMETLPHKGLHKSSKKANVKCLSQSLAQETVQETVTLTNY